MAWTVANEGAIRFAVFFSVFLAFAAAEAWRPDRMRLRTRLTRWVANLGLALTSTLALRLFLPGAAVLAAVFVQMRGWGALNLIDWPLWLEIAAAMVVLDAAVYAQHVLTHRIPLLWRLHRVHHADHEVDVTTALRFHPVEIVLSMLFKVAVVFALGAPAIAVILFEIVLNASAMFNHANLKLQPTVDAVLRSVLVTPDMHRIHHSQKPEETDSNFGISLSVWDRLFGTYVAAPQSPLTTGLSEFRDAPTDALIWTLVLPFRGRQ